MRFVLDTNVLVSAVLWGGVPGRTLTLVRKRGSFLVSPAILAEFAAVIVRPKFAVALGKRRQTAVSLVETMATVRTPVADRPSPIAILADPTDEKFLAYALAYRADALVTGDRHLLALRDTVDVPIMTPTEFVRRFRP